MHSNLPHQMRLASLLAACIFPLAAGAQTAAGGQWPVTAGQRAQAAAVAQQGVPESELRPDAPATHRVVRGDTLWGISGRFLKHPWLWPALWGMNLQQIRNPNRIYPGQVLTLVRANGRAYLSLGSGSSGGMGTVRLAPGVRTEPLDDGGIPAINPAAIAPFLSEGIIVSKNELDHEPRVVATPEDRLLASVNEQAYVRGPLGDQQHFRIYRTPKPIRDPETDAILGYEATFLGTADLIQAGHEPANANDRSEITPSTIRITSTREDIPVGARLTSVASAPEALANYVPHAAPDLLRGAVASIYGDSLTDASVFQVVLLTRGASDGMENGHIVALWRRGKPMTDATDPRKAKIRLPDERYGLAMVFKTYDHLSYALVLQASNSVRIGDAATAP